MGLNSTTLAVMDGVRTLLWWLLVIFAVVLGLYYKRKGSRSQGWKLYLGIFGCIVCQAAYMTMWAAHNSAVRTVGYGPTTDTLYRICIPLYQLAMSTFMGLLLLLAAGYSITRNNLGNYKGQVIGLPILLFVTGVVTDYINFHVFESTTNQIKLLQMAGWEQGLWFVCTFLNLAAFGFWVVYMFEIIQQEVDAIKAQQELNLVRNAAPSATVAPFPGSFSAGNSSSQQQQQPRVAEQPAHAAPPPGLDPHWTQAAAEEGIVAYKNLLGPGQNMSHVPGADVEAQEINTVADMVNFEVKKKMYRRFSTGFGVFMIAQLCVILSPVFVIDIVQEVITFLQFVVVMAFLGALLWLFRPAEDSPYLLMGEGLDTLDTALGVDEEEDNDGPQLMDRSTADRFGGGGGGARSGGGRAVELMSSGAAHAKPGSGAGAAGGGGLMANGNGLSNGGDRGANRDQWQQQQQPGANGVLGGGASRPGSSAGGAAAAAAGLLPPVSLPAIKTSAGGSGNAATAAPAAAPAAAAMNGGSHQPAGGAANAAAKFSLGGDDDEELLHEIQLDSAKAPDKRD